MEVGHRAEEPLSAVNWDPHEGLGRLSVPIGFANLDVDLS